MKFERILNMTFFDNAFLEKLIIDYIRLKNPEFKKTRLTEDKELLLFAEDLLQQIS